MKVDFAKALGYPLREAGAWVKLVVLTLLVYIIIGIPLFMGFVVETKKAVAEGEDDKLPAISDFPGLLFKGVGMLVIGFIYGVIPAVCLSVAFGSALLGVFSSLATGSATGAATGLGVGAVAFIAVLVLSAVIWIIMPMATLRYATSGGVGAAFDFGGLLSDMGKGPLDYIAILIFAPVVFKIGTFILALTTIGLLVLPLFGVYLALVVANLMGQYHRAHLASLE